jgi:TRAP-type C4-dicarboxylate transport system substrate-binding protein
MKRIALGLLVIFLCAGFASYAYAAPLRFRFAGQQRMDHLATQMQHEIAKEINERTQGRVEVTVFPADQLGNYSVVMAELIRGTIDMGVNSFATEFDPRFGVLYINGFVLDYDQARKVFHPDAWLPQKLNELGLNLGVRVIGSFLEGFIGLGSTKELIEPLNPAVDKGVLTRVPNMEVFITGAQAMGFRTQTVPWSDVFQALQTGLVDAVDGMAAPTAYTMLGDVLKHWYVTNYSVEVHPFMVSEQSWKKLTPGDQEIFRDVARKFTLESIRVAEEESNKYLDLMEKRGMKVHRYTTEELQPIKKAVVATWDQLAGSMGKDFIDEFKKELGN